MATEYLALEPRRLDRLLAMKPPTDRRELLAMTIYESARGEWWRIADRSDRKIARKQADAVLAKFPEIAR